MSHPPPAEDARSLHARIAVTAEALRQHRLQSSTMAAALANRLRSRISSPAALTLAAGFGFVIGKRGRRVSNPLLALFKTATQATLLHRALQ